MFSDNNQNLFSLLNPLDLTCQSTKYEELEGVILLPYSSLILNNTDKIPFKIGQSGELILANFNYENLFQSNNSDLNVKNTNCESSLSKNSNELLKRKLKDIKMDICNGLFVEDSFKNEIDDSITFLNYFKEKRIQWKLFQSQITKSLYQYHEFPKISQSYLSRLEKLDVTYRSSQNVISYLKLWLKNSEELFSSYIKTYTSDEFKISSLELENLSKFQEYLLNHSHCVTDINRDQSQMKTSNSILQRKKRTVFSKSVIQKLNAIFSVNQFPKGDDIKIIAINYKINQESIMQWFSNQRRKLNKDIKI